ncbi:MAG TPA: RsmB/NOP family class I SAM-dependent RNA methyltransferase [Caldimonas sp.]|jgi:16S rRNA (cytosine967-C5)-methyltransferase
MHPKALLEAATELVRRLLRFEHPADRVVADFFRAERALGARDRQTLADGVFALLRKLALWRHLAKTGDTGRAVERRLAILAWQGSDELLDAALDEGERAWLGRCRAVDPASLPEPLRHNLPDWLAAPLRQRLGDEFLGWVDATSVPAPLDLRVNTLKTERDAVLERLDGAGIAASPTPHSPLGIRVVGKPALQKADVFAQGLVEPQDEGSQLLALIVGARRGEMVVDFCAGAGGKTLALGAQMKNTGRLYAFDVSGHRLAALQPRLQRSGLANVHPAQIAPERDERIERLAGKVDRVLVDAPCSGSGTLRRHPDLKWRQDAESCAALVRSQRAILAAAARLVKPGGRLVYSTCSVLDAEGEAVADDFENANTSGFMRVPVADALRRAQVAGAGSLVCGERLRLWTHRHATDSFFAAIWQRA